MHVRMYVLHIVRLKAKNTKLITKLTNFHQYCCTAAAASVSHLLVYFVNAHSQFCNVPMAFVQKLQSISCCLNLALHCGC